ncbi:MAG TPA: Ig-like domain-containing protein, partial [Solirubrobacteraceae bacterium]
VTLRIYAGGPSPVQTVKVTRNGGSWTTGSRGPHLADGTYTAQVTQSDAAENVGQSAQRTFTIKTDFPMVKLNPPGQVISDSTPSFTGNAATASGDIKSVTLTVYRGESTTPDNIVESLTAPVEGGGTWAAGPTRQHLPDGTYIAQAEQKDAAGHAGVSEGSIFIVDTTPPQVTLTLTSPSSGNTISGESLTVSGTAGTVKGDLPAVTIQVFAGSTVGGGEPLESVAVNASKGLWSATLGGLGAGTYTVRALQRDQAGNVGISGVSTFMVTPRAPITAPPSPQPGDPSPAASFTFFPTAPKAGESISLASSSTDAASPIVAYAWDLTGSGQFQGAGPVLVTSFATPGSHVVRLRVTAADGLSSIVAETIAVGPRRMPLMQPFPIVRIVGSDTRAGARLSLLSVQAPVGARVTVGCRGGGCPAKPESRVAVAGGHRNSTGVVLVAFRRFERPLRAGASLEIRVSKPGEIGKYTRFRIRRNRPPLRVDACLDPTLGTPIACPSS